VDLTQESSALNFFAGQGELWASVHIVGGFAMAPIEKTTLEMASGMWTLNFVTAFLCCREALARMKNGGRIVNVAARPALEPVGGMTAYATSKAAVVSLTRCLAAETLERGICVNAIVPSIIDTPGNRAAMPDADHSSWPTPSQLAKTIGFLVSPDAATTSGATIPVYGAA